MVGKGLSSLKDRVVITLWVVRTMTYNTYCTCILATPMPPGKSTMLSAIAAREVPIPDHIDIFHLTQEIPSTDKTPLQCVMEVDQERWVWQLDHFHL